MIGCRKLLDTVTWGKGAGKNKSWGVGGKRRTVKGILPRGGGTEGMGGCTWERPYWDSL